MNYVLRIFFYSFGLSLLLFACALDPATAQFKDLLTVLHVANFWDIVVLVAAMLVGTDMIVSGKYAAAVDVVLNTIKRLRGASKRNPAR